MAASKPARSTSTPASRASSSVSSTGKPWVSCRVKATSPPSTFVPVANASSSRPNPARRVRSKPASSRATTLTMRSCCATSAGYASPSTSVAACTSVGRDGLVDAEAPGRHHGTPHDAAQHVAAALVGRQDAVGHEHGHGPPVVGQHAQRDVGALVGAVAGAEDGGRRVDDRREQVGVEHGVVALEDGQDPLEAGAGVDVLARQLGEHALGVPVELHEDEVPDLDEALVAAVLGTAVVPVGLALVDEDLRVGAAGAGVAHGPEVVLVAHALDALGPHADLVDPDLLGLVVAVVHGDPEAVAVEAEDLGEELPGHRDGVVLEVVAEAEVAQHLEEGAVVGVGADDVDVGGAEALLDARWPGATGPAPRPGSRA